MKFSGFLLSAVVLSSSVSYSNYVLREQQKVTVTRDKKVAGLTRKTYRYEELR